MAAVDIINYTDRLIRVTYTPDANDVINVDIPKGCFTTRELDADNLEIIFYDYVNSK